MCRFSCGHKFSIPLDQYRGVWLLDWTVRVCLVWWETSKLSLKVTAPFHVPTSGEWEPLLPQTLVSLWCCRCLEFGHANGRAGLPHCGFSLHSSDDTWCGASFHTLLCHLRTVFDEVSVKVFGSLSNPGSTSFWSLQAHRRGHVYETAAPWCMSCSHWAGPQSLRPAGRSGLAMSHLLLLDSPKTVNVTRQKLYGSALKDFFWF